MITIDTITGRHFQLTNFPDGQCHVDLRNVKEGESARVVTRLRNAQDLVVLMMIANALDNAEMEKTELNISYLFGGRYDRSMRFADSVDLKVAAQMINMCGFKRVTIFDAHSDVALQLIERSKNINNQLLVRMYEQGNALLICPDAGAAKKLDDYSLWNPRIRDSVYCIKSRNLEDGAIKLKVLEPERCADQNCVIIDDICDGGATFLAIASQIKPKHLTLIVSHGIFSKGVEKLLEKYNQIITSDSFQHQNDQKDMRVWRPFAGENRFMSKFK